MECAEGITLKNRLNEAEIAANFGRSPRVPGLNLFWSAFWLFGPFIGAEQGGSSSLHVRTGSCTLQQLRRPFVQGHIFYGFFPAR